MTKIQVEVSNQVVEVTYDQYNGHDPFGEAGYSIYDFNIMVDLSNEKDLVAKSNCQVSFRYALEASNLLKADVEYQEHHIFMCQIADDFVAASPQKPNCELIATNELEFNYIHQLEAAVSKLVFKLTKVLADVKIPYQIKVPLSFSCF